MREEDELDRIEREVKAREFDPARTFDRAEAQRRRQERAKMAAQKKTQLTIRLDADVVQQFKELAGDGQGYQGLINRALIEWLQAQDMRSLLREEIQEVKRLMRAGVIEELASEGSQV